MKTYDIVIIGSGPGGYVAAIYASRLGMKVAVIEKELVGGTCLNRGCIPTKVMLNSARILREVRDSKAYGIEVKDFAIDFETLVKRREDVVTKLRNGVLTLFRANSIELIRGSGRLKGAGSVDVDGEEMKAKNIIIATGSQPMELKGMEFDGKQILSSTDILNLKEIPKSLLIVGGGVIGCEFAQFYSTFGTKVFMVEFLDRLLPGQDREVSKKLEVVFKKAGIEIQTSKKVEGLNKGQGAVKALLSDGSEIKAEKVLVSVGTSLNSKGIGLEDVGVKVERSGIVVNSRMETSVSGVWAIGDVIGGPMLAHAASYEGMIACDNITGKYRSVDYSNVPSCIYTQPGIATIGLSEEEAKKGFPDAKVARFPYLASSKANVMGKTDGFIKIIGNGNGKILGVVIFGEEAYELIGEAGLAKSLGATVSDIGHAVHGHPTLSEIFQDAAHVFSGTSIHTV